MEAISTNALLDLIGLTNTTGNARRISKTVLGLRTYEVAPVRAGRMEGHCHTGLGAAAASEQKSGPGDNRGTSNILPITGG